MHRRRHSQHFIFSGKSRIYFSKWRSAEGPDVDLNGSQHIIEDRTEWVDFSVDIPEGGSISTRSNLVLRYATDSEEAVDTYTELLQLSRPETNTALMRKEDMALIKEDAEHFSQTLFTVKASFEDGSTQMKCYRIVLVDDFEQKYNYYLDHLKDFYGKPEVQNGTEQPQRPCYFRMEEVS